MSLNGEQARQTRVILERLRARLVTLEQEYNRFTPPDGDYTLGRRTLVAHQKVLAEIVEVRSAIHQREKELGDA